MHMKVGKRPQMCGAMYQYYKTTKINILSQTSSDTLSDALSEAMKKLSIKAKKQLKRKMERPRAASYSVEISRQWEEKERDEDEYSIIGVEANYEVFNDKEVNNNEIVLDLQQNDPKKNENEEFDSFKILRSKSMSTKIKACDEESYEEFWDGIKRSREEDFPVHSSTPCPPQDQNQTPVSSNPTSLDSALQAFSQSTATDRSKMKLKMPDPDKVSVHVRDKFSLERRSMITLPMMTVNQIKPRPKTAPDNSELEREWRRMMLRQRKPKRQMSI